MPRSHKHLLLLLAATWAAFALNVTPLVFFIHPLLVLVLLRVGLGWASLTALGIAILTGWFTLHRQGPLAATAAIDPHLPNLILQVAAAASIFLIYTVSALVEGRDRTQRRLREIVSLHTLMTENSRDAIVISHFDGTHRYFSPPVYSMSGFSPAELKGCSLLDIIHTEDRHRLLATFAKLRSGVGSALLEWRVQRKSGDYIWVEGSLTALPDPRTGAIVGAISFTRDISGRKKAEQQLQEAYRAVEALAITDGLTGIANRRRFDQALTQEWRRGLREHSPLSMLLIDADHFKAYNDTYGHLRGDSCLRQIVEAALDVVSRPGDLVARFGGEEFAILLPNTDSPGAVTLGRAICASLAERRLPHMKNPNGTVTISIGCATVVPRFGRPAVDLVEEADQALYRAKQEGRNRVCFSGQPQIRPIIPIETIDSTAPSDGFAAPLELPAPAAR